ncbi:ATPase WRNIP1-like [Toxorhynchites rutilus septentrionalis]|uniref:ATPase WRNIP1-like n=1 Tax=Toxorhynchites rutilus septentrionalis TaxID=329112 RepID=UPI00247A67FB|nr:ATPase WRNIP1-like [Toxorhynchites rutilus septentrionalis]
MSGEPEASSSCSKSVCPVCDKLFPLDEIETHVDRCLFLNSAEAAGTATGSPKGMTNSRSTREQRETKRSFSIFEKSPSVGSKRVKTNGKADSVSLTVEQMEKQVIDLSDEGEGDAPPDKKTGLRSDDDSNIPLAEKMRPSELSDYIGQEHIIGKNTVLRTLFEKNTIPSMILWGPPGCGKTTLAHIIAAHCKKHENMRFVKLSATMSGVNEVKEAVKVAKNETKFKRRTILFMDEIHRFNKLQQDIFLPHVESGTITLIGATTENPSFSLNSALLSRCRVIVLERIAVEAMMKILERALPQYKTVMLENNNETPNIAGLSFIPKMMISSETIRWLAGICDGDARIGLNSLQLALNTVSARREGEGSAVKLIALDDIEEGIKKSHLLYDSKGDQHYELISALHKSVRASDDNAALYWCTRMLSSGEDPRYLVRRMIRMASEDIGVADTNALTVATSTLAAVQAVGMPEADCIIAHCAVYLARAPKSREVYNAFKRCKAAIEHFKGPMPSVPLHLRNATTKLMKNLNYGTGYNLLHKDQSGLQYMPEGLEDENYFSE